MKQFFLFIGVIAIALGLLWIGQGLGYIRWPAQSFMISQQQWAWYGGVLAAFGLTIILLSR